jgi:uncharacterized protein involved in exopolysaccharide biosynthesis
MQWRISVMSDYEDEIDVRPYLVSLIRHWWLITVFVIVASAIALTISFFQPRNYQATATILLTRSRVVLSLAQQFPTVNEPVDTQSRMNAILSIARSDSLALQTFDAIKDQLPVEEQDFSVFKKTVTIANSGDIISINASAKNPELAAGIANEWARQAVEFINLAYSGEQLPSEIQNQLITVKQNYEETQAALEAFIEDNNLEILQKQINLAQNLSDTLAQDRTRKINYYTQRMQLMDQIIAQAEALQSELENESSSTPARIGDALAVLLTKAMSFGINPFPLTGTSLDTGGNPSPGSTTTQIPGLSLNIQLSELNVLDTSEKGYSGDLDRLIQQASQEKSASETNLQKITQEVLQNQGYEQIEEIEKQIQQLQMQLEVEQARQRLLISNRDLAWQTFQALTQKEMELKSAVQTSNQVNLASQAIPSQQPSPRGTIQRTVIAAFTGLIIAVSWVFGSYWWKSINHTNPG